MLRLEDRWVWDFWFAEDRDETHLFFLQAPRSLGNESARHYRATIGHAVSRDLVSWTILPDALGPGRPGAWDDLATWTGSVIKVGDTWSMFYTGVAKAESGLVQRIGRATSTDLVTWERVGHAPLIEADGRWYELLDLDAWHDQAWRDPWLFADPAGNGYHALITARRRSGASDSRGVIGHAFSHDLVQWEVLPPIASPAGFGQLEVPQVVPIGGSALLVFSTAAEHVGLGRRSRQDNSPRTGTYICRGPDLLGPFDVPESTLLGPYTELYAGKIIERAGELFVVGFAANVGGEFRGEISDPIPFDATADLPVADSLAQAPSQVDPPSG